VHSKAALLADVPKGRQQMQHVHAMHKVAPAIFIVIFIAGTRQLTDSLNTA
jgi:hypothetical protein